ncbi:hypothetical protein BGW39_011541 [Mortierella sp. 14UC]|nr:hypothetical protein BGW39_011541 [Mortierella sp. 14UC]
MDKVKDLVYGEQTPSAPKHTTSNTTTAVHPHRCAKHVEDLMVAIMNFEVEDQMSLVWKCMRSEKGDEPARHSPASVKPDHSV